MTPFEADPLVQSLRPRYPRLIAALATVPEGERHLQRMVDLDQTWLRQQFAPTTPPVVVERISDGAGDVPQDIPTFDLIYAGGGLNVLNAAVMAQVYGRRVLVFDRFTVGAVHREWNISQDELDELIAVGLLEPGELHEIVQHRYKRGLVHFHNQGIGVPAHDLWMNGVLDVAIDADALTTLCLRKIRAANPANVILNGITFERALVGDQRVAIQARDNAGKPRWFAAPLLIDGMGSTSPVACQLNCGQPYSLVCPTVGTVATGYGDTIDPTVGEILITTEHARDGRQLIWEAFPGQAGQVAIYLFYYAATGEQRGELPESLLLPLFEDFFTLLPEYKDPARAVIHKPVYGFIPAGYKNPGRARDRKVLAFDRVLSLGDAAALQSPLTFCGFGSNARNLRRITGLLDLALTHDRWHAAELQRIHAAEATPALQRAFSKFMIGKAPEREAATQVNETLNVFCRLLAEMSERSAREFFQDRVRWWDYTRLVLRTAVVYPKIFPLTFRTLSPADGVAWIAAYLAFTATALRNTAGRLALEPLSHTSAARTLDAVLWRKAPRIAWRLAAFGAGMRQALRVARQRQQPETSLPVPVAAE